MGRPRDVDQFLTSYPNVRPNPSASSNLLFYSNKLPLQPDNLKYEEFMRAHERDYVELELNHGYIQWFFPIREHGVNPRAQPLEPHEIKAMEQDSDITARLLRSYKMMLRFYGIEFDSGRLQPSPDHKERLDNLRSRSHNLLRLTRILKHLSEFPTTLQPHAAPLVLYFVAAHSEGLLSFEEGSMRGDSMDKWWSNCFRDEEERKEVRGIVRARGKVGVKKWGWEEYRKWFDARGKKGYTEE
ncbi:hypothetical protein CI109_106888 [Kwoniella shandongensis]|uniref:Uncharacterized protein n=1 Tax=Kwoniella shandongensis TaxID=1734106 RepID=A0A5M6C6C6_9TREE|nr:uncharacterized protein CI109_000856 [Kwoniella shandongensis]KAA5530676.1 hypothetical protein CI109_000856 [Kwoniella shandongensis]